MSFPAFSSTLPTPLSLCKKWFDKIYQGEQLDLSTSDLAQCLEDDFNVKLAEKPMLLQKSLPLMLSYFMKNWPGWDGEQHRDEAELFQKFQEYLKSSVENVISNDYATVMKSIGDKKLVTGEKQSKNSPTNRSPQCNVAKQQKMAPFTISLKCSAAQMNSLIFTSVNDDVLLKQHAPKPWTTLNLTQLLNWPDVRVTFCGGGLRFQRSLAVNYERCLNLLLNEVAVQRNFDGGHGGCGGGGGERAHSVKDNGATSTDTETQLGHENAVIVKFISRYLEVLNAQKELKKTNLAAEVHTILTQFSEDLTLNSVENTSKTHLNEQITVPLTQAQFVRNKKLSHKIIKPPKTPTKEKKNKKPHSRLLSGDSNSPAANTPEPDMNERVGFYERLVPTVQYTLMHFMPTLMTSLEMQYTSAHNPYQLKAGHDISVEYECTFCMTPKFSQQATLMHHLREAHRMEFPVRCIRCKTQFEVAYLANCRWKHNCKFIQRQYGVGGGDAGDSSGTNHHTR